MRQNDARVLPESKKRAILERDCYICAYCDGVADCVDHVVPWSFSKCDEDYNLVASCTDCNLIALDKIFESFEMKRAHIRGRRDSKKYKHKLNAKISYCTSCYRNYINNTKGATKFLCPDCAQKEYPERNKGLKVKRIINCDNVMFHV